MHFQRFFFVILILDLNIQYFKQILYLFMDIYDLSKRFLSFFQLFYRLWLWQKERNCKLNE